MLNPPSSNLPLPPLLTCTLLWAIYVLIGYMFSKFFHIFGHVCVFLPHIFFSQCSLHFAAGIMFDYDGSPYSSTIAVNSALDYGDASNQMPNFVYKRWLSKMLSKCLSIPSMLQWEKSSFPEFTKQAARMLNVLHHPLNQQCYIPCFPPIYIQATWQISLTTIIKYWYEFSFH